MKDWEEVAAWRAATRAGLIEARESVPEAGRREKGAVINGLIEQAFVPPPGKVVAFCWPYRGEVDIRFAVRALRDRGVTAALPVVRARASPLEFRSWRPGVAMVAGPLGIPAPQNTEAVTPDLALVPVVGFDAQGYRLGYGGGYFDRTLAALERKPIAVGIGLEAARLPTIHPQPHDIPMDYVVTEAGIHASLDGRLVAIDPLGAQDLAARIAGQRGLWRETRT